MHRGHAAVDTVEVKVPDSEKLPDDWSELTSILRQNPAWHEASSFRNNSQQYQEVEARLVDSLLKEPISDD